MARIGLARRSSWYSDWVPSWLTPKKRKPTERELFS
jgi:phosphatidylinositol glycan class B